MTQKLTHTEACKLVECSLERAIKTLAYIRQRLERAPSKNPVQLSLFEESAIEDANLLCNINWYGAYLKGVKATINALRDYGLLDIPKPKGGIKAKDYRIYNKAIIDLIMKDCISIDRFLGQEYDDIRFTDHERDKKGKLTKCRAYFAKRVTTTVEIKD